MYAHGSEREGWSRVTVQWNLSTATCQRETGHVDDHGGPPRLPMILGGRLLYGLVVSFSFLHNYERPARNFVFMNLSSYACQESMLPFSPCVDQDAFVTRNC